MLVFENMPGVSGRENEEGLGGREASFEEPESPAFDIVVVVLVYRY